MTTNLISLPSIDSFNAQMEAERKFQLTDDSEKDMTKETKSEPKRKRVKTGCLTCRKRHRKCDEQHPKCMSCRQKGFECVWPVKTGVFVNNSQVDFPKKGGRKVGNRIGDRILNTIKQEKIPASYDPLETQRSLSLGFLGSASPTSANGDILSFSTAASAKRSNSEFNGMAESPSLFSSASGSLLRDGISTSTHPGVIRTSQRSLSQSSTVKSIAPPTVGPSTTNALNKYSDHLQAISLAPYTDNNSKMDLPSLLNGADMNYSSSPPKEAAQRPPPLSQRNSQSNVSTSLSEMSPRSSLHGHNGTPNSLDDFFLSIETESVMERSDYNDLHNILRDFMYLKNNKPAEEETDDLNTTDLFSLPDDIRTFEDLIDVHSSDVNEPVLTNVERLKLLRNFAMCVAPTLDMFDYEKHFSRVVPRLALECPALMYAALAYSAKHLERIGADYPKGRAVEFYRYSLQQLIPTIKTSTIDLKIVCACLLLCCLEMMSSSPMNWRRHLEGCFALFTSCNIHGFSEDSFSRAMFWCFARMDICSSIISEKPTIIPYRNWIPQGWSEYDLCDKFADPKYNLLDMYANHMVFLCSRVMNLLYNDEEDIDLKFDYEWEKLWNELKDWEANRPDTMLPILSYFDLSNATADSKDGSPFPTVLYTNSQAISGNQMFHMAVILMAQNKPRLFKFPLKPPTDNKHCMIHRSIMSHARQIIGISVSNRDHPAWINMIQPFWIAGKLMGAEHEQKLILQTIKEAEQATGWAIAWRGRDLVEYWNRNI